MSNQKAKTLKRSRKFPFRLYVAPVLFAAALFVSFMTYKSFQVEADCGCNDTGDHFGQYSALEKTAYFLGQPVTPPLAEITTKPSLVLGDQADDDKWIEVDLSDQVLRAWDKDKLYLETLVSTGKWNRTPTGEFRIWSKFRYTKMSGGSKENNTYYYLPNVPFTMYFKGSYGIHGTYWHNNFGTPMSHGCVNMPTPMAEKLFYWASPQLPDGKNYWIAKNGEYGTRVVIHE